MNRRSITALGVLSVLSAACGSHAVDLDDSALTPSADPTSVGTVRQQVMHIVVDAERLYWLGSKNVGGSGPFKLSSCAKADCVGTLLNYGTDDDVTSTPFSVQNGEVYWARAYPAQSIEATQVLDPTRARTVLSGISPQSPLATDGQSLYLVAQDQSFSDGISLLSVPLTGAPHATRVAGLGDTFPTLMQAQGDYVYLLSSADYGSGVVQRVRADGTADAETLASGFELSVDLRDSPDAFGGLALDANYVYWSVNVLAGSIVRCPLAGCTGAPETVVAPVRAPGALLVDRGTLYFEHETDAFEYAVSSCSVGHCEQPTLVAEHAEPNVLAVDDQYLYTATTGQDLTPDETSSVTSVTQIRRLPR